MPQQTFRKKLFVVFLVYLLSIIHNLHNNKQECQADTKYARRICD